MSTLRFVAVVLTMAAVGLAVSVLARRGRGARRDARVILGGGAALGGAALVLLALGA